MARVAVMLLGCLAAAYTDARTGLIYDKITYPMIAIAVLLNIFEQNWVFLAAGMLVFGIGYAIYYAGKIGGGDVKLFSAIAMLLPIYSGELFLLNAMFASALLAVTFYAVYFLLKYWKQGIQFQENRGSMKKAALFGVFVAAYFGALVQLEMVSVASATLLAAPLLLAVLFMAFEHGIRKNFFLKQVKLKELEEDEVIAVDFLEERVKKGLKLGFKGVFGGREISELEKMGVKDVPVYRGMPPFAPFILLGCIAALVQPNLISILIL